MAVIVKPVALLPHLKLMGLKPQGPCIMICLTSWH